MSRVLTIIICGAGGGLLAKRLGVPGGAVVGAMLGSGLAAVAVPGSFSMPEWCSSVVQIMLGISLGITFDRSFIELCGQILPLAIFSTLVLLAVSLGLALLAARLGLVDFATALFGFSPGGMSGMSLLAQAEGYRTSVVAFFHTVRIFTLFLVVPVLGRLALFRFKGL